MTEIKFVRVYMSGADKMLNAVMQFLHFDAKVQGLTVTKAVASYDDRGALHSIEMGPHSSEELPVMLEFFDEEEKAMRAAHHLKMMLGEQHILAWTAYLP